MPTQRRMHARTHLIAKHAFLIAMRREQLNGGSTMFNGPTLQVYAATYATQTPNAWVFR